MIHVVAFAAVLMASFVYASSVGGRPERYAATALLAAFLLTLFVMSFRWTLWRGLPVSVVLIDCILGLTLTMLALKANRLWPIVLAGMQVATLFGHVAKALAFPLPTAGYAIFVQLWGWPMLAVAIVGTYNHGARIVAHGDEQDWKPFWPELVRTN